MFAFKELRRNLNIFSQMKQIYLATRKKLKKSVSAFLSYEVVILPLYLVLRYQLPKVLSRLLSLQRLGWALQYQCTEDRIRPLIARQQPQRCILYKYP